MRVASASILTTAALHAEPQLTSSFTEDSGQYARIYQSTAAETAGTVSKTWNRGTGVQSTPTYAGVSQIACLANWVYVRSSGLAGHIMGPWYLDAAKSANFRNFPSNRAKIYRIPRLPVIPASKTITGLGATGCMVNGVSMFDMRDAFSYVSGPRRMVSGFVLRNGNYGTTNLTTTGRTTLPAWAQRIQTVMFKSGPAVGMIYLLGHYIEDFDYLGDHGYALGVDFDLNEQNVRWCVTPEFPGGTTVGETVTITFNGGPNKFEAADPVVVDPSSGDVTLTWSSVEGGTYLVEAPADLIQWPDLAPAVTATDDAAALVEAGAKSYKPSRSYRISRTALAAFDSNGFDYSISGSSTALRAAA